MSLKVTTKENFKKTSFNLLKECPGASSVCIFVDRKRRAALSLMKLAKDDAVPKRVCLPPKLSVDSKLHPSADEINSALKHVANASTSEKLSPLSIEPLSQLPVLLGCTTSGSVQEMVAPFPFSTIPTNSLSPRTSSFADLKDSLGSTPGLSRTPPLPLLPLLPVLAKPSHLSGLNRSPLASKYSIPRLTPLQVPLPSSLSPGAATYFGTPVNGGVNPSKSAPASRLSLNRVTPIPFSLNYESSSSLISRASSASYCSVPTLQNHLFVPSKSPGNLTPNPMRNLPGLEGMHETKPKLSMVVSNSPTLSGTPTTAQVFSSEPIISDDEEELPPFASVSPSKSSAIAKHKRKIQVSNFRNHASSSKRIALSSPDARRQHEQFSFHCP